MDPSEQSKYFGMCKSQGGFTVEMELGFGVWGLGFN